MNQNRRSYHPSEGQVEDLVCFLERNPGLAFGFPTVPSAREQTRKLWERQALHLNSLGSSVKTWKQWRKYWTDKKTAVKKKAALRAGIRNRTGGGVGVVIHLTDIEERILALMGGESFATGDRHLGYQPFQNSSPYCSLSPSQMAAIQQPTPNSPIGSMDGQAASILSMSMVGQADAPAPSPMTATMSDLSSSTPQASNSGNNHTISRTPTPAPHRSRDSSTPHLVTNEPQRTQAVAPAAASPPSQRRSQFVSVADRFLRVEENQQELNRTYVQTLNNLLQRDTQRDRVVDQALSSLQDSLKVLTQTVNCLHDSVKLLAQNLTKK